MATLRSWMQDHDGQEVHTLQTSTITGKQWAPGPRVVDASRASYVRLGGSRRDYAGVWVMEATSRTIDAFDSNSGTSLRYWVAE